MVRNLNAGTGALLGDLVVSINLRLRAWVRQGPKYVMVKSEDGRVETLN